MKIKLKHRHTQTDTHTQISPSQSLSGEILHLPEDIDVATSIFLQIFLFHFFFFILFKRLVLRHSQACFCIIRASGCIWRQTNDSSAFRLKREPLLIYPKRYIDRGVCNAVALSNILQHKPNDMTSDLSHLNYSHGFGMWQLLGMLMCIFQNSESIGHHHVHAAVSHDEWLEWSRGAMK